MHAFSTAVALVIFLACASNACADPPPSIPDYLAERPANKWVFGEALWKGSEPCTSERCEAGYYSPPLVLSVTMSQYRGAAAPSVEAVAGVLGCPGVVWEYMPAGEFVNKNSTDRHQMVAGRTQSIVKSIGKHCDATLAEIPTDELRYLFSR
jgi:hypothetical protein